MFIGRHKELQQIQQSLKINKSTAILVYGRRRIGKTSLINEALKSYTGIKIVYTAIPDEIEKNALNLSKLTGSILEEPWMNFSNLKDYLAYISKRKEEIVLVIDEYQDIRGKDEKQALIIDACLRDFIDYKKDNIKLIISGSAVRILQNLSGDNTNPLFGRFSCVINLQELNYIEASEFYKNSSIMEKIGYYAVFGGLPNILSLIDEEKGLVGNIESLLLQPEGLARYYIETVLSTEVSTINNGNIIVRRIGNGKKHYAEIESTIQEEKARKQLSKTLSELMESQLIEKQYPINKLNDKKKSFYVIKSNLLRFWFAYLDGFSALINPSAFFEKYITPSLKTFISYRFETIVRQYFASINRPDIISIGSYWYDDKKAKRNGEFDIALETITGYEIYEAKYYEKPITCDLVKEELEKALKIEGISLNDFGIVSASGFENVEFPIKTISGTDLYSLTEK